MRLVKWAAGTAVLILLLCAAGCGQAKQGKEDIVEKLTEELKQRWQQVDCTTLSREECESAFTSATLGRQEISLPDAEQYHLITCKNPDSGDENVTILATGTGSTLAQFVQGMGFRGYNVEYQASTESDEKSIYQWTSTTWEKTCMITVTAGEGPLEIQVEVHKI